MCLFPQKEQVVRSESQLRQREKDRAAEKTQIRQAPTTDSSFFHTVLPKFIYIQYIYMQVEFVI